VSLTKLTRVRGSATATLGCRGAGRPSSGRWAVRADPAEGGELDEQVGVEVQQLADDVVVAVGRRPVYRRRVPPLVARALPPQREVAAGLLHRGRTSGRSSSSGLPGCRCTWSELWSATHMACDAQNNAVPKNC